MNKPDGLTFIGPSRIEKFMESLPVEKFFGVGKVTAEKMKSMGIYTGLDLKKLSAADLTRHFGKPGRFYFNIVRGIDDRVVQPHRETKSIGAEDTFPYDLVELADMTEALDKLGSIVRDRIKQHGMRGRTITLKIKYHDFKQVTRSLSLSTPVDDAESITATAIQLLLGTDLEEKKIRLLGISVSNFRENTVNRDTATDQLYLGL
jgi:DNA polymerase-4